MMTRRQFVERTAGAVLLANGSRLLAAADAPPHKPPYRVLYSNDTTNILTCISPYHKKGETFRPEMIEATVDEVAGMGVDAHLFQPGLGWVPWWKSKVYSAAEHCRWFKERTGFEPDPFNKYMLDGGDMVQVFIERCRQRGQAPFISLRMNDGHHLENANLKNRMAIAASRFYCEHPEYRIGTDPEKWEQRVLNWAIPEVRAHKLAFITELCENYDFDGFEMDFMRFYSLFQLDKTTSAQRSGIMAAFVKQVRAQLDRNSRNGRRRWLCARVPCFLEALDAQGLDLPALVEAGLDMVNVSASYFTQQQCDLAKIRQSVPRATVYMEMCHSIWNGKRIVPGYDAFGFRRATPEQYYTTAHLAYARGADGMSLFNFVYYREHGGPGRGPFAEPPFHVLKHLADREWLARQPQHYLLSQGWCSPVVKNQPMPRTIAAKQSATFALDLAPPTGGWQRGGRLRIQSEASMGDSVWSAQLNGETLKLTEDLSEPYPNPYTPMLGKPEEMRGWIVPARLLRDGQNQLRIAMVSGQRVKIGFMDLAVS